MIEVAIAVTAWLLLAVPAVAIMAGGKPDVEDDLDVDLTQPLDQ